jgi:hypothetical protein
MQTPQVSASSLLSVMKMLMPVVSQGIGIFLPEEEEKLQGSLRLWITNRRDAEGNLQAHVQVPFYAWKEGATMQLVYDNTLSQGIQDAFEGVCKYAPVMFGTLKRAATLLGVPLENIAMFTPKISEYIEILRQKGSNDPDAEVLIQIRTQDGNAFVNVYLKNAQGIQLMHIDGEPATYWLTDLADRVQNLLENHINQNPTA